MGNLPSARCRPFEGDWEGLARRPDSGSRSPAKTDNCLLQDLFVMRANRSQQHLVTTGLQSVIDVAWGTAPLVPPGAPGTLARPPAGAPATGASRLAGCREAPGWVTGNTPFTPAASLPAKEPIQEPTRADFRRHAATPGDCQAWSSAH